MANETALVVMVGLTLIVIIPLVFYYLGTVGGISLASMSTHLVYIGAFLFAMFITVFAISGYMRRR